MLRIAKTITIMLLLTCASAAAMAGDINLPGKTMADTVSKKDILHVAPLFVFAKAKEKDKNCNSPDFSVLDTQVVSAPKAGKWREAWIFGVCNKKVSVPIEFKEDSKGKTTFSVKGTEAKIL